MIYKSRCHLSPVDNYRTVFYSTAQFKLDAGKYILVSSKTFSPTSQQMFASKGNMLLYMILLAIELDACMQLLARMIVQSVDAPEQDYMLSCIILLVI